ncbi:hypothetical protein J3E71DRAFT_245722 [Bipolaris maydis]|nr:hypothetical protein J3E71DRAFT_245722 [Bipolaris maydis]
MARWAVFRAACLLVTLAAFVTANPVLINVIRCVRRPKTRCRSFIITRYVHEDPNDRNKEAYWYRWSVWVGPQGVAVNPCEPGPFSFSRIANAEGYAEDGGKILYREITDPPYLNEGSWSGAYPKYRDQNGSHDCVIKEKGEKGPAVLDCGETKIEFRKDAQFDDGIKQCGVVEYHRAWTVEY